MKLFMILFVAGTLLCAKLDAQTTGKVIENEIMKSTIVSDDIKYSVYLPPDYDHSKRDYPVVYLLHGYTDDNTAWIQFGEVNVAADKAINKGEIPAMIIVMPDAKVSWYMNDHKGKYRFEDMFINEFIPYIDKNYRTKAKKEFRGISGLSMGGFGSLHLAMKHTDMFTAVAALSPAVYTDEEFKSNSRLETIFEDIVGKDLEGEKRITEHWKSYSPFHLLQTVEAKKLNSVKWYIDCGDDDFLFAGNVLLAIDYKERKINLELRVRDGKHQWEYWRTGVVEGLKFIGNQFKR